ncbi:MAG: ribbon-helix-helix domain-containing protein [Thainema sp.]
MVLKVSKRVFLTLPDAIADALERWAEKDGGKAATLAGFLVEREVRAALKTGEIPPETPNYESIQQLVLANHDKLLESGRFSDSRLKELESGDTPSEVEIVRLALLLGLSEEYVMNLLPRNSKK